MGKQSVTGTFQSPPADRSPVTFLWGGDVAGQKWGIDPKWDGMYTFRSMQQEKPNFFIYCGDSIYADDPIPEKVTLDDGEVWNNIVTPSKSRVARTLSDFHGNYRYNLLDRHYRSFLAQVPVIAQWDDHEVLDNWNPTQHGTLARSAFRAFKEYWPVRAQVPDGLYRKIAYGPSLDVFVLDLRSYRAPNSDNRQSQPGPSTALLGRKQLDWFKKEVKASTATWKVIAGEMPISPFSPRFGLDSWANGEGAPLGREFELAELLQFQKKNKIRNLVWLGADVHYAAAIEFQPARAVFKDFTPFWEFIAGPLHAGTFSPDEAPDPTFGAQQIFCGVPLPFKPNRPPRDDFQFYGKGVATDKELRISLHQRRGIEIFSVTLKAES